MLFDYTSSEFNFENLTFSKPIITGEYRKSDILYNNKKLCIKIPKMEIPFEIKKFNNFYKLSLSFNKMSERETLKSFYNFIVLLDKEMEELVLNSKKKYLKKTTYISCIKKNNNAFPPYMNINLPIVSYKLLDKDIPLKDVQFKFKIFDEKSHEINIASLHHHNYVLCIIELDILWINEQYCGLNWNVLQIKKVNSPHSMFNQCLLDDSDNPTTLYKETINIPEKQQSLLNSSSIPKPPSSSNVPEPPKLKPPISNVSVFVPPSEKDLQDMINKMRMKNKSSEKIKKKK